MKATSIRQYRKRETGKLVFVYTITGTPEEMAAYKTSKGENYREDEATKQVLMFSTRYLEKECSMIKTSAGVFVPDTTKLDQLANLADQYGIDVALTLAGKQIEVES